MEADYFTLDELPVIKKTIQIDELEYEVSISSESATASSRCAGDYIDSIKDAKIKSHVYIDKRKPTVTGVFWA